MFGAGTSKLKSRTLLAGVLLGCISIADAQERQLSGSLSWTGPPLSNKKKFRDARQSVEQRLANAKTDEEKTSLAKSTYSLVITDQLNPVNRLAGAIVAFHLPELSASIGLTNAVTSGYINRKAEPDYEYARGGYLVLGGSAETAGLGQRLLAIKPDDDAVQETFIKETVNVRGDRDMAAQALTYKRGLVQRGWLSETEGLAYQCSVYQELYYRYKTKVDLLSTIASYKAYSKRPDVPAGHAEKAKLMLAEFLKELSGF